eukprot:15458143-Alexandrium_andersonii.AAC.2
MAGFRAEGVSGIKDRERQKETVPEDVICSEERDGFVVYDPDDTITARGSVGSATALSSAVP